MKQEMITFLSTCENDVNSLCKYLYENPEDSYREINSSTHICDLLEKYEFKIEKNYCNIPNSFLATKGTGYPKICFLCEYDAVPNEGHLTGHNILTATSIYGALALGKVISKLSGTVMLIGCPGEYLGGTKSVLVKQGVFEDVDAVLLAHPDTTTSESGTSSAIIPLSIKFEGDSGLSFLNKGSYTSLDAILLTFNILNSILKGFPEDVEINSILSKGGLTPLLLPMESEAKFYIRAKNIDLAELADLKLREIAKYVSNLIHIPHTCSLYEPPNEELLTNRTLNRLFSHNLKENGIIHINQAKDVYAGLSIGVVSKTVPSIHPYFSIVEDDSIKYGSPEFALATTSTFALEQAKKTGLALAFTGFDLISNEQLLKDVKAEFFEETSH